MGKVKEFSILLDELKKCVEMLAEVSAGLTELIGGAEEQTPKEEKKPVTLEEVRQVLAERARAGFTAEIKAIITKHGAAKLSEIDPAEFESVLAEAEALANAG